MNPKKFFKGQTETYLLERLEEDGYLKFEDVYSAYSQREAGKAFMSKLIHFDLAFISAPGIIKLKKEVKEDVKEIVKDIVKNHPLKEEVKEQVKSTGNEGVD